MAVFWFGFAVIAGDVGDQFAFARGKAEQIGVADQMIGMTMVAIITDEVADIMKQAGGDEQVVVALIQSVTGGNGGKDGFCQAANLFGVLFVKATGPAELDQRFAPIP